MPDFGFNTNIPQGVQPSRTSLADMVNTAAGLQSYQQAREINPLVLQQQQQATRTGQIALDVEEKKNIERNNVMQFMSNPDNYQTNGRIDLDKMNKALPAIAPLTHGDVISKFTTLGQAQTQAIEAKQKLTQEQRNMVASRFGILGRIGVQDKNAYLREMDLLKAENPENPDLHRLIDAYKITWADIQSGPNLPGKAIAGAQTMLKPSEQQALAPTAGTLSTGAQILPTVSTPSVGGMPPSIQVGRQAIAQTELSPSTLETPTGGVNPITGLPQVIVKDVTGRTTGFRDVQPGAITPTGPITPTVPIGESLETGKVYQQQIIDARAAATPAKVALNNIDTVLKYLPLAATGKFSEAQQGIQSVLGSVSGNNAAELAASARDIISKTIEDLALNKNAALGGKFASDLAAVQKSIASAERNPTAIKSSMEQLRPLLQHAYNYSQGLDKAVSRNPTAQYVKPQFDAAMNEAFDMKALMMLNAYQSGSTDGLKKWTAANKVTVPEQQRLFGQLERYKALVDGDLKRYNTLAGAR